MTRTRKTFGAIEEAVGADRLQALADWLKVHLREDDEVRVEEMRTRGWCRSLEADATFELDEDGGTWKVYVDECSYLAWATLVPDADGLVDSEVHVYLPPVRGMRWHVEG